MAQTQYCNPNTDLVRAFARIEEFVAGARRTIKNWKPYTTLPVQKISNVGYTEALYEDGAPMTKVTSITLVNSARKWFYDSTTDTLYQYPTGGVFTNHTYTSGPDITVIRSDAVNTASREAEAALHQKFPIPLPASTQATVVAGVLKDPYDRDLIDACAKIACGHLVGAITPARFSALGDPLNEAADLLFSGRAVLQDYATGKRTFSWELTAADIGTSRILPNISNTSFGMFQLRGQYQPSDVSASGIFTDNASTLDLDPSWKIKITVGGAYGTAKFQLSLDDGTTYNGTSVLITNQWTHLSNNVFIRWSPRALAATDFVANDTWTVQLYSPDRKASRSQISSARIRS